MTVAKYRGLNYPQINVMEHFNWEHGVIAKTLWYNSLAELLDDARKTYETDRHNPFLMKWMKEVVERITAHLENNSNIVIFWDFDVDGISASSVLFRWLRYLGVPEEQIQVIIPNREIGYSIKKEYILEFINNPLNFTPDLIITVDCWIKSASDVEFITNHLWIEVVITDHHGVDPNAIPTAASAVVNPHLPGSQYPFKEISGSLVALKVIEWLSEHLYRKYNRDPFVNGELNAMAELRELAMLWTIADVMPIIDENRWLVKETLSRLEVSYNLGLRIFTNELLKQYNKSKDKVLTTDFIGWQIGPRINAAWRIWDPSTWLHMFINDNPDVLMSIFNILDSTNKNRQDILAEEKLLAIESERDNPNKWIVYIKNDIMDWIIWLVAGNLKEEYYKPTVVIGWEAIHLDIVYNWQFTNDQEVALYSFLFSLKEYLKYKYETEQFYWYSIKDWNKILFSINERALNTIEDEFKYAFSNVEEILFQGIDAFISDKYFYSGKDIKNKYSKEEFKKEMAKIYPKLSEDYLLDVLSVLKEIDFNNINFVYTNVLKWSCRSIDWFHITEALETIDKEYESQVGEKLLLWYGWHPLAAWFWIKAEKVADFKALFEDIANRNITDEMLEKKLNVNIEIDNLWLIDKRLIDEINSMGPFGNKNEYPKVLVKWRPVEVLILKNPKHAKLFLEDDNWNKLPVLFFRYKDNPDIELFLTEIINWNPQFTNKKIGIVWNLDLNEWEGVFTPQLIPIDIVLNV